ncbi:MAG: hypothetical protein KAT23_00085 [Anaerolineales bacterium]|nr:hypothetical protein [Anaerolineales bacterium]
MGEVRVRAGRSKMRVSDQQRFLIGALLATAFFLIEAGVAEIYLAREAQCQAMIDSLRIGFSSQDVCMPKWVVFMLGALSRGVVGLLWPKAPSILAWLSMGGFYAVLGGGCGQLSSRWGILIYLAGHTMLVALLAGLGYLSQFIG